jgi:hypothetical protein
MKKFIVSILAILYLGLSTGATINMHYCMGKLVGSSLWHSETSDLCNKCGMEKKASKNKCCKDETKVVKIEQDQKVTIPLEHAVDVTSIEILQNSFVTPTFFVNSSIEEDFFSNAPPLAFKAPIYLRNCDFRI